MNKRERLQAAINKQPVDRPPIALWRHFPGDDLDAERFARRVIDFQRAYDFDFVKVTPAASYVAEMYGGKLRVANNREGTRDHVHRVVNETSTWRTIEALDSSHTIFQREHAALRKIRSGLGEQAPILQTIFSPLSAARSLAGEEQLVRDLREHPAELHHALDQLATTTLRFALDALDAGADAIFFATQLASFNWLTETEYRAFGQTYDLSLLNALKGKVQFSFIHAHGENIMFDLLAHYPAQILNWHDRKTAPTLTQGKSKFHGAVAGGIEEWNTLADGTPEQIRGQIGDAVQQTQGVGLVITSGCVIPTDTPDANIRAARAAVG